MDNNGLSIRFVIYISIICSVLLSFIAVKSLLLKEERLYICGEKDRLESFISVENITILLMPHDSQNVLACLGRGMKFYDRTIDYIIGNPPAEVEKAITERYTVGKIVSGSTIRINKYSLTLDVNSIRIDGKMRVHIYTRPITSMNNIDRLAHIIRPPSNEVIEELLEKQKSEITILRSGEYTSVNLSE